MVVRIQSEYHKRLKGDRSLEQGLRGEGHQFKQGELVTKDEATKILQTALAVNSQSTVFCKAGGRTWQFPLDKWSYTNVYITIDTLINTVGVRSLEVKDG